MNLALFPLLAWALLPTTASTAQPLFHEAAAETGLLFRYSTGATGELYFPEIMGGGAALFDYDLDGDLDALLVQAMPLSPRATVGGRGDRLFRNDLGINAQGQRVARFVDVTPAGGLTTPGYGMGVAVGDINRDGYPDLLLTRFGHDRLLVNLGDGRFEDRTELLGPAVAGWSTSASVADFDGDGWSDVYITRYVDFSVANPPKCFAESTRPDYCGPSSFRPTADRLLRNRGGQGFEDVSVAAGLTAEPQPGLGVIAGDFDHDGRLDFFVANDGQPNQLWLGQPKGTFRDEALLAGVALDRQGKPQGSMGIDAGDFDRDGDLDLFVTNLASETHALYVDLGQGLFAERSVETGLAAPGLPFTGFGTVWLDADLDGGLDLFVANGAVRLVEGLRQQGDPFPFGERNQLFLARASRFEEALEPALEAAEVSRGVAMGDVDNDGDTDLLVVNEEGPARLLLGTAAGRGAFLAVANDTAGQSPGQAVLHQRTFSQLRHSHTDGSYLSSSDPRLLFGLGSSGGFLELRIDRPGQPSRRYRGLPVGRYLLPPNLVLPAKEGSP